MLFFLINNMSNFLLFLSRLYSMPGVSKCETSKKDSGTAIQGGIKTRNLDQGMQHPWYDTCHQTHTHSFVNLKKGLDSPFDMESHKTSKRSGLGNFLVACSFRCHA